MRIIRFTGFSLLFIFLMFSFGCKKPVPVYVKVTGSGVAEILPEPREIIIEETVEVDDSWADGDIVATGFGAPPTGAANKAQARLMTKQAAKLDAMRRLTEQLEGVEIDSATTVKNFVTEDDEIRSRVQGFIRGAEVVSEEELDDGSWEVKMRMSLRPLARVIKPARRTSRRPAPRKRAPGVMSPAQARLMAERAAKLDAYRQIAEHIKGVSIKSNTTVRDFMAKDDRIRSRVDAIIRGARVTDRRFNDDGTVEVDMELKHPDITQVIR
jgi:hypothetical protein